MQSMKEISFLCASLRQSIMEFHSVNLTLSCSAKNGKYTIALHQWCLNFLARGPHLSFRNPSQVTRMNILNKNSLK